MKSIKFTESILKEMGYTTEIVDENNITAHNKFGGSITCTLTDNGTKISVVNNEELKGEFPEFFETDNDRDGIILAASYAMKDWMYEEVK